VGRCLPEYRALKEKYSFLELVRTPELAAEVTLQPIGRFAFDAAILFSDILVVPEAMGQGYHFRDAGGIQMDFTLRDTSDITRLNTDGIIERLQYVAQALQLIKPALSGRAALLGFAGSPWTLANFMLEGGSTKHHTRARSKCSCMTVRCRSAARSTLCFSSRRIASLFSITRTCRGSSRRRKFSPMHCRRRR
jgi:uroporphyrinogen decarboxylase